MIVLLHYHVSHSWLLGADELSMAEDRLLENGFDSCIDYPHLPGHVYYEGYFHACEEIG
jgi:hypothetical protein